MTKAAFSSSSSRGSAEAGFSLLELAIVLVILGIIGSVTLPLLSVHIKREAYVKTRSHQEYVLNAIAAFVKKNNRFPCPAEPHILGANFGVALVSCRLEKAKGIIPFKTLGIHENYARDGFKRLMTYVVEPELTKGEINPREEEGGFITVKNEEGSSVVGPINQTEKIPNYIAIVIISHGESGVGAYKGKGQSDKIWGESLAPAKRENLDDDFTFIDSHETDDLLRWETRDQFLQHYVGCDR